MLPGRKEKSPRREHCPVRFNSEELVHSVCSPSILIKEVKPEREKVLASPMALPSRVQSSIVSESLKCFGEKWKKRFQSKQCVGSTLRAALSGMLPQFILSGDG